MPPSRYRMIGSLGHGGMGQVWHARDEILERDVAIKEIDLVDGLGEDTLHRRTLREARAAARLSHPNVVQVFDVLEVDGRARIVMEYVPSRSLHQVLRDDGPLDPRAAAAIGLELLAALRAAHRAGVDHRDVKPANVLLADDGRVLLTDFGIATIEGDSLVSSGDMVVGSPEYMSPERARHGTAGLASDLWSLGATLYAAVEGRSPFRRGSAVGTLTALATEEPDPPRRAGPLRPVLDGLLRKNPAERIDAAEAERRLRTAAGGSGGWAEVVAGSASETLESAEPRPTEPEPTPVDPAPGPPAVAGGAAAGSAVVSSRASGAGTGSAAADSGNTRGSASVGSAPAARGAAGEGAGGSVARSIPAADPGDVRGPASAAAGPATAPDTAAGTAAGSSAAPDAGPASPAAGPGSAGGGSVGVRGRAAAVPPVPDDDVDSAPARRPGRRVVAVAAVVLVAVLAVAAWLVTRPDPEDRQQEAAPPAATTAPAAPAAGPSAGPSVESTTAGSAPANPPGGSASPARPPAGSAAAGGNDGELPPLPAGWTNYRDRTGFSLYVPADWSRSREGTMVYFRGDGRVLGIDQTDKPQWNPVADWQGKAEYRVGRGDFPGYREVHIKSVDYWRKAADWEFTFTRGGVRQHVNNRGFITANDQAYGVWWQTSDASWAAARKDLQLIFDSFRPAA